MIKFNGLLKHIFPFLVLMIHHAIQNYLKLIKKYNIMNLFYVIVKLLKIIWCTRWSEEKFMIESVAQFLPYYFSLPIYRQFLLNKYFRKIYQNNRKKVTTIWFFFKSASLIALLKRLEVQSRVKEAYMNGCVN